MAFFNSAVGVLQTLCSILFRGEIQGYGEGRISPIKIRNLLISSCDYITYVAFENDKVVGFIGLLRQLNGPYMILDMMQVSSECRGQGVGRQLFELGKAEARKAGAEALYISACSSEETIAFYRAMGSDLASNPIKEIDEEEPCDLQMICPIEE